MKILIPFSGGVNSTYSLYRWLSETDADIISLYGVDQWYDDKHNDSTNIDINIKIHINTSINVITIIIVIMCVLGN